MGTILLTIELTDSFLDEIPSTFVNDIMKSEWNQKQREEKKIEVVNNLGSMTINRRIFSKE